LNKIHYIEYTSISHHNNKYLLFFSSQKPKPSTRARTGALKRRISKKNLAQGKIQSVDQLLYSRKMFKDYEETLTSLMNIEDPLKELFIIPKDDFVITKEERLFREAILCFPVCCSDFSLLIVVVVFL
jgi:hypothetical protein